MAYANIGNVTAEWNDNEPFIVSMSDERGSKDDRRVETIEFNLAGLRAGFEDDFILHFRDHLIERSKRIRLVTVNIEYNRLSSLFNNAIKYKLFDTKIAKIDGPFLLALNTIIETLSPHALGVLKQTFNFNPHSPLFAQDLRGEDFPRKLNKKGHHGNAVDSILAKFLTRAACVEILNRVEQAYEDGQIDIGLFSFINTAFAVYVRPDSYRRIRLDDLVYDTKEDAFFLYITPAKSGVHKPQKICYRINKHVGALLQKQRQHVINTYGHLVDQADIGKLSLFPARALKADKSGWISNHANKFFGELKANSLSATYFQAVQKVVTNEFGQIGANVLRHTIGTQLALQGCSAKTIGSVLKHASDRTCVAYVDIAFNGLIGELSDAMRPAFEAHMPVFQKFHSKVDVVQPDKAVYSEDIQSLRVEFIGECGKQIRCQFAPFTCYECNKFIPCFDAEHSLNLDIIQEEINQYKKAGTAYKQLVEKFKSIKYRIQLVMAACDRRRQALEGEEV
jgi:hypothetical protein